MNVYTIIQFDIYIYIYIYLKYYFIYISYIYELIKAVAEIFSL